MVAIYHVYYTDGGFGDGVEQRKLVAISENEVLANRWAETFSRTHVFATPYEPLTCGTLEVESMDDIIQLTEETINVSPWSIPTFNNFEWEYLVEPSEK